MLNYESKVRLKLRRTKIVATMGPASISEEMLSKLISTGMNVARLNFSHGSHESHLQVIERIRKVSQSLNKNVAILGDLCGPKIRVGHFENGQIPLIEGENVVITVEPVIGKQGLIHSQYTHLIQDIKVGQMIFLDDGNFEIEVASIDSQTRATCKVVKGGTLKNNKGMNLPGSTLSVPALTEKDYEDLKFCLAHDVDYVALSFVRRAEEIKDLKEKIKAITTSNAKTEEEKERLMISTTRIIAKIENPEALKEIQDIIDEADGIMIARGDLGVELPVEKVPIIQAQLIKMTNQRNKPVIVATQMLESMTSNAHPTRAEVSDVATAVMSGTDAVMLSGETAAGKYPVESVKMMDSVIREVENYQWSQGRFGSLVKDVSIHPLPNAIARASTLVSQDLEIRAINVPTYSGRTARIISVARPNCPIIAYCDNPKIVRQIGRAHV